jgi:hypothetical protein
MHLLAQKPGFGAQMRIENTLKVIGGHDTYSPTYSFRQTADALKENRKGEIRVLIEPPAFRRSTRE